MFSDCTERCTRLLGARTVEHELGGEAELQVEKNSIGVATREKQSIGAAFLVCGESSTLKRRARSIDHQEKDHNSGS